MTALRPLAFGAEVELQPLANGMPACSESWQLRPQRPSSEVQWHSPRLEVIREIRQVAQARRISKEAAMHFVTAEQRQSTDNCSLDLYYKRLRANRKTRA